MLNTVHTHEKKQSVDLLSAKATKETKGTNRVSANVVLSILCRELNGKKELE